MRTIGIVLIIAGIAMLVIRGFTYTTQKKVVDIGPIEINKEQDHYVGWPVYAGGAALIAGVVLVAAGAKKKN